MKGVLRFQFNSCHTMVICNLEHTQSHSHSFSPSLSQYIYVYMCMYSMCFPGIGLDYCGKQQAIRKSCRSVTGTVRPQWCMFSVCRSFSFLFSSHYLYEYVLAPKSWFCHHKHTWKMSSCLHTKKGSFWQENIPMSIRVPVAKIAT